MPYRSMPGRPGRKLAIGTGAWGQSVLTTQAATGPKTPAQYGRDCERAAELELKRDGWTVNRSHLSRGAADLIASKLVSGLLATTAYIQVKSCQQFSPTFCNRGVREVLQAPPVPIRSVWGYVKGHGHVVTIDVSPDGRFAVNGKQPYAYQVHTAITKLLSKPVQPPKVKKKNGSGSHR